MRAGVQKRLVTCVKENRIMSRLAVDAGTDGDCEVCRRLRT